MARNWVQETPAGPRRPSRSTAPLPEIEDGPTAEIRPIVPAARRPVHAETDAPEARTA
ncbi:MAG: hypothetical protein L0I76_08195 [Pseudonocardia sp.]|nr:hypothetical protein [Pseudonocardia sp.]